MGSGINILNQASAPTVPANYVGIWVRTSDKHVMETDENGITQDLTNPTVSLSLVFWANVAGSPVGASNTTFTVTGDYTALFKKGLIVWWKESSVSKFGMVSIPSTYGAPNTTVTIIGDTMASIDANSLKYSLLTAFEVILTCVGNIDAVSTNQFGEFTAFAPFKVLGADVSVGVAGTTNASTFDVNKNGATMFTTKPTLASTVRSSPTPFTANNGSTLALGDQVTVDIDAVQTTPAVDAYLHIYLMLSRLEFLT